MTYIVDGNQTALLTLTPSSADSNYSSPGLAARDSVPLLPSDDDSAGFTLSETTALQLQKLELQIPSLWYSSSQTLSECDAHLE